MSISDFTVLFIAFLGGTFTGIYLYGILKKNFEKEEAQKQDVIPGTDEETRTETAIGFVPPEGTKLGGPGSLLP